MITTNRDGSKFKVKPVPEIMLRPVPVRRYRNNELMDFDNMEREEFRKLAEIIVRELPAASLPFFRGYKYNKKKEYQGNGKEI
ncbi:MAG: hypothetical protein ABH883_08820 [Candidatus Omnitrophota bacterium]